MAGSEKMATIHPELNLDQSWCLGEGKFAVLSQELQTISIEHLVEFGSGISSVRLALQLPQANLLSIESNPDYYQRTLQLLDRFAPDHRGTVQLRKLSWQRYGLGFYQCYEPGLFNCSVDAVIIDGPPGWTFRGREACLYQIFRSLRVGGRVYLDDYERPDEQQAVQNWQAAFPGVFEIRVLETSPTQLCVLEKVADSPRLRISLTSAWNNWTYHAKRRAVELRDRICSMNR